MSKSVLNEWGVEKCEDFGEIVFNLVKFNVLGKTDTDSLTDFKNGFSFHEAFVKPFRPQSSPEVSSKKAPAARRPRKNKPRLAFRLQGEEVRFLPGLTAARRPAPFPRVDLSGHFVDRVVRDRGPGGQFVPPAPDPVAGAGQRAADPGRLRLRRPGGLDPILVRHGSIHEGRWLGAGISHLLEHHPLQGDATSPGLLGHGPGDPGPGRHLNAYTSFDRTVLPRRPARRELAASPRHPDRRGAALPDSRERVRAGEGGLSAASSRWGTTTRLGPDQDGVSVPPSRTHPYRFPVIGHLDLFNRVTRDDVVAYYRERYAPQNLTLVVCGAVDGPAVADEAARLWAGEPRRFLPDILVPRRAVPAVAPRGGEGRSRPTSPGWRCSIPSPACITPTSRRSSSSPSSWAAGAAPSSTSSSWRRRGWPRKSTPSPTRRRGSASSGSTPLPSRAAGPPGGPPARGDGEVQEPRPGRTTTWSGPSGSAPPSRSTSSKRWRARRG